MRPNVYIIAGPNGAGKTTFAREFLPLWVQCKNFINADLIAQGISPFAPEAAAFRAGRLVLEEINAFINRREDFAFESTLSGKSYLNLFRHLKDHDYSIHIYFLWVPTADVALSRVRDRVSHGGHNVPESDLRRRFERSMRNFLQHYRQNVDSWMLFNNSIKPPVVIADEIAGSFRILDKEIYQSLIEQFDNDQTT